MKITEQQQQQQKYKDLAEFKRRNVKYWAELTYKQADEIFRDNVVLVRASILQNGSLKQSLNMFYFFAWELKLGQHGLNCWLNSSNQGTPNKEFKLKRMSLNSVFPYRFSRVVLLAEFTLTTIAAEIVNPAWSKNSLYIRCYN